MPSIPENLDHVRARIERACRRSGRVPESVTLVAVTKTVSPEKISEALRAGILVLGENRIQEALPKMEILAGTPLAPEWHFIGKLQRNKVRQAAGRFRLIHSVDTVRLAEEIDRVAGINGQVQEILLEVNVGGETTKEGFSPEALLDAFDRINRLKYVRLRGLMTVPPPVREGGDSRDCFRKLKSLLRNLRERGGSEYFNCLSMGMSDDFEAAVEEGATHVRLGRAIFGERGE